LANVIWVSGPGQLIQLEHLQEIRIFKIFAIPFQSWGFHEFPVKLPYSEIVAVAEVHCIPPWIIAIEAV
jgi:hypothetical protein